MRNKIFVIVFSIIFVALFLGAPISRALTELGVIEYNNVGNVITPDKTYSSDGAISKFLNGFENVKVEIKDTYINNLPFYLTITNNFKPLEEKINAPVINWLQKKSLESYSSDCRHVWQEMKKEPTCSEKGEIYSLCRLCGIETEKETLERLDHTFVETNTVDVSCESDGYTLMTCSVCGETELRDVVVTEGHKYELIYETPATCTSEGVLEYVCTVCQSGYSVDTVRTNHTYGTDGKCIVCGSYDVNVEIPDGHEHSYSEQIVAPTCTEGGYTLFTCECSHSYKDAPTPPAGHKYNAEIVPSTCQVKGYTLFTCSVCSASYKGNETEIRDHNYKEQIIKPTKTEGGYSIFTCEFCSDAYKDKFTEKLADIPEPTTKADESGTEYTATYKSVDSIFRYYELSATYPDGNTLTSFARIVKLDREVLHENMLNTVKLVNTMVEKDRNVNWYFYFPTNIEVTEVGEKMMPQESTRYIFEEFLAKVDPSVKTDYLKINSFRDYFDKNYITDHHWNHEGFNEAYLGIVRMLNENYSDIVPFELKNKYVYEDVKFYGSLSRVRADYDFADNFGLYYYSLPEHNVVLDDKISYGSESPLEENIETYNDGMFSTSRGFNHYTEFFRICKEVSVPNNNTGRNLLLIGDSYSMPLLEIVSCHFDNAYIRYEDRNWNNFPDELIYEEFIKEYNITDVIVIEEPAKCVMQGYGSAYPSGFLNIFPDENW